MDPERWHRVTEIFHAALNHTPGERAAFLDGACVDATLRADVDALLAGDARAQQAPDPMLAVPAAVSPGTELGPYRIESLLGVGGMGEVYGARDTRLNRPVAIKVLPSAFANDAELRQRFEREAQAIAALRHPRICVLYDIGHDQGVEFLVMEHLEGETLEHRLKKGALLLDHGMQYAIEIAEALHSAHRAGITHRDLKPGNIMLTKDGAKLLDFGMAKFGARAAASAGATAMPTTPRTLTSEGTIVGTFQYMAPEQLEGKNADERTDLFAFGAVVYEMITGRKAFTGDSRSNVVAAILRDEPPPMSTIQPVTPPALDVLVRTCLAKDPDARLQSAHDVAQQLRWIRDGVLGPASIATARPSWLRRLLPIAAAALVAAAGAGGLSYTAGRRASVQHPEMRQLTFKRGVIGAARFTPDGQSVVYAAAWDGRPTEMFSMRLDTGESQPLPIPQGSLHAISRTGELAMVIKNGTLAHVPLGGGGVRELANQVTLADWLPDGSALVAVRSDGLGHSWLEFPLGMKVHEWSGTIFNMRVSPDGSLVAVQEMNASGGGWITLVDRKGQAKRMTGEFSGFGNGLIWSRTGDEVWFSASAVGLNFGIHGVTRSGVQRVVHQAFGNQYIQDQTADGRVLIVHEWNRAGMVALAPGEQHERELSWLDFSRPFDLSADGTMVSFTESGAGVGPVSSAFVRPTDGSPAIRIGEGQSGGVSPDGNHLLMIEPGRRTLKVVPIGAGDVRRIDIGSPKIISNTDWTPDGTRIVFAAREAGHLPRLFVVPAAGGPVRTITPEGVAGFGGGSPLVVSSDSRYILARDRGKVWRYPIEGGDPLPLMGLVPGDTPVRWSADGRSIWVLGGALPTIQVFELDVATGRRTLWREIATVDPAGFVRDFLRLLISADGKSYVYGYLRTLSDLYIADGVK